MHELSIAHEAHRVARAHLPPGGQHCLERVVLAVGELAAVEPDLLRFAWEAETAGGPDADSVLEVEWRPARQVCTSCATVHERAVGTWLRLCPICSASLSIEGGDELDVLRVVYGPVADRVTP